MNNVKCTAMTSAEEKKTSYKREPRLKFYKGCLISCTCEIVLKGTFNHKPVSSKKLPTVMLLPEQCKTRHHQ